MGGSNSTGLLYSVPVSTKKDGETAIHRHPEHTKELITCPQPDVATMKDVLLNAVKTYSKQKLLGWRETPTSPYLWLTYKDCLEQAEKIGSGILALNLNTHVNEFENLDMNLIGVFSKNRYEWLLLEYANYLYDFTMVPFYDTLGPESISFMLEQTNLETIFCSAEAVESLLKCPKINKLKTLVLFDDVSVETKQKLAAKFSEVQLIPMKDVIAQGSEKIQPYAKVSPTSVFTFSYTSGTTGNPKGVLLTHLNLVSVIGTGSTEGFNDQDVYISYLPLPHIMERLFVSCVLHFGGSIGFYHGNVQKLKDDLQELKPTLFLSVPRLYGRFYDVIKQGLDGAQGLQGKIAKKALAKKMELVTSTGQVTHSIWDKIVFKKTKQALGGRVRWAGVGSAPISGDVLNFLKATLCTPIAEGYGSTESCGASFSSNAKDPKTGHVGGCRGNYEFKLVDIPELSYTSLDKDESGKLTPRGEICIRGSGVFIGYYKEPEKTKEVLDEDGWLHTGDVGLLNVENGSIKIIDRKKNIFKLSQGEYIAPEKIEGIYIKTKGVNEVFVHGDSLQSTLMCFVVPDEKYVKDFAELNNLSNTDDFQALCNDEKVKAHFLAGLTKQGKADGLFGFEQAKAIHLEPRSFQELDCMTNTFKIKRNIAKQHYSQQIVDIYNKINEAASAVGQN